MYFQVIINSFSGFGPYCLSFKENEPCTVYNLKQRLATTTTFRVEEQRIRSLGGKTLTDSMDLLEDYSLKDGPIILNLTVSLIGGRSLMEHENHQQLQEPLEPFTKKTRLDNNMIINTIQAHEPREKQQHSKGKEKESRKRKRI